MASSTGDGSHISDAQAEPECTATPRWLSPSRIGSASTPSTRKHTTFGNDPVADVSPSSSTPSTAARRSAYAVGERPRRRGLGLDVNRGARGAEARARRDVLVAASARPFLGAADEEGRDPRAPPHEQRGRARRSAELVGRDRAEVDVEGAERERHVADRGAGVDVHAHAVVRPQRGRDALDRLHRGHLVIRELHAHERGVVAYRGDHGVGVDPSVAVDAHHCDGGVGACERVAHGGVLDRARHHVGAGRHPPVREVDGLGARAAEDHFARSRVDERGDVFTGLLERDAARASFLVQSPRVAVRVAQHSRATASSAAGRSGADEAWSRYVRIVDGLRTLGWRESCSDARHAVCVAVGA